MAFTYATLKTAIQDYMDNDETTFANNLDNFIKTTEEDILKNVELNFYRKNVTGTATSGNAYLGVPSDFLAPFSLAVISSSVYYYLLLKHPSFIRDYTPNASTTGQPKYYGEFDNDTFILAPTPDDNYSFELHYFYRPTSLTAGASDGHHLSFHQHAQCHAEWIAVAGCDFHETGCSGNWHIQTEL